MPGVFSPLKQVRAARSILTDALFPCCHNWIPPCMKTRTYPINLHWHLEKPASKVGSWPECRNLGLRLAPIICWLLWLTMPKLPTYTSQDYPKKEKQWKVLIWIWKKRSECQAQLLLHFKGQHLTELLLAPKSDIYSIGVFNYLTKLNHNGTACPIESTRLNVVLIQKDLHGEKCLTKYLSAVAPTNWYINLTVINMSICSFSGSLEISHMSDTSLSVWIVPHKNSWHQISHLSFSGFQTFPKCCQGNRTPLEWLCWEGTIDSLAPSSRVAFSFADIALHSVAVVAC